MSDHLAIATVTASLRNLLNSTVAADVSGAEATAVRPDGSAQGLPETGVNIYLYQVAPSPAWRNADLPTRTPDGRVVQRPRIGLDLSYLLSFYGDEALLQAQRVLGSVVRTLHARPVLDRDLIESTVTSPTFDFVSGSDLAREVEQVRFTLQPLSLEELSKLWSVFFQTPYALSVVYHATVVLLEAEETARRALPVHTRSISVSPFRRASIGAVVSAADDSAPVAMNDTLLIRGAGFDGPIAHVRVGGVELSPVPGSVTPKRLEVELDDPALRAGVVGVQVVFADGSATGVAPLVLRPVVDVVEAGVTASAIPVDLEPEVGRTQRVRLLLNELGAPATRPPHSYGFDAPAYNGVPSGSDSTGSITFAISGVEPATYLVRVEVDGAENVPAFDAGTGAYTGPTAVVP